MEQPRSGVFDPRSTGEFQAWFRTDADHLEWLRWPGGFTCPDGGHAGGWRLGDGRLECTACHGRTSYGTPQPPRREGKARPDGAIRAARRAARVYKRVPV